MESPQKRRRRRPTTLAKRIDLLYQDVADLEEANQDERPNVEIRLKLDELRQLQQQEAQQMTERFKAVTQLDEEAAAKTEQRARELLGLDE